MNRGIAWQNMRRDFELRKSVTWNQLNPGRTFPPYVQRITQELIDSLISLTNDRASSPVETDVSRAGDRACAAPQVLTMLLGRLSYLGSELRPPAGSVLRTLSFDFFEPMMVSDTITATGSVKTRSNERDARQYTIVSKMVNQTGKLVATMEVTVMLPMQEDFNGKAT